MPLVGRESIVGILTLALSVRGQVALTCSLRRKRVFIASRSISQRALPPECVRIVAHVDK